MIFLALGQNEGTWEELRKKIQAGAKFRIVQMQYILWTYWHCYHSYSYTLYMVIFHIFTFSQIICTNLLLLRPSFPHCLFQLGSPWRREPLPLPSMQRRLQRDPVARSVSVVSAPYVIHTKGFYHFPICNYGAIIFHLVSLVFSSASLPADSMPSLSHLSTKPASFSL